MKMTPEVRRYIRACASLGGHARAKSLTKERRKEIAQLGAKARWRKVLATQQKTA